MTPLSPSQKKVLRVRGLIAALVILVPAAIAASALFGKAALPSGLVLAAALLAASILAFFVPGRHYRAWGYDSTDDELHIRSGILVERRTIVPFGRVQHIDVSQGPIERRYGVGTLTLHTAGTRNAAVALSGLDLPDAERMRDEIRGKIRQDLV